MMNLNRLRYHIIVKNHKTLKNLKILHKLSDWRTMRNYRNLKNWLFLIHLRKYCYLKYRNFVRIMMNLMQMNELNQQLMNIEYIYLPINMNYIDHLSLKMCNYYIDLKINIENNSLKNWRMQNLMRHYMYLLLYKNYNLHYSERIVKNQINY